VHKCQRFVAQIAKDMRNGPVEIKRFKDSLCQTSVCCLTGRRCQNEMENFLIRCIVWVRKGRIGEEQFVTMSQLGGGLYGGLKRLGAMQY
jgi:hypothetical protein